ncbi:hypothetical protein ACI394_30140, partial [Klebsiella pneumoniae]|uniref:hypothetical protein n=1 Tax=Klebsiella pneumoniae TaxID=573 RepID=UPI0038541721
TAPITVLYSATNKSFGSGLSLLKVPQFLIQKDGSVGYSFVVDSMIWNTPNIKACVFKAVKDWKCLSGINWKVDTMNNP